MSTVGVFSDNSGTCCSAVSTSGVLAASAGDSVRSCAGDGDVVATPRATCSVVSTGVSGATTVGVSVTSSPIEVPGDVLGAALMAMGAATSDVSTKVGVSNSAVSKPVRTAESSPIKSSIVNVKANKAAVSTTGIGAAAGVPVVSEKSGAYAGAVDGQLPGAIFMEIGAKERCNFNLEEIGDSARDDALPSIADYSFDLDDVRVDECRIATETVALSANDSIITEKFDTAASRCLSGVKGRITEMEKTHEIAISGFNGSRSAVDKVGVNRDGKLEYFLPDMPLGLVLLCANDYVQDGAAVLFPEDGKVLRLAAEQQDALRAFIAGFPVEKDLVVRNRTYEVATHSAEAEDEAFGTTVYLNTKAHASDQSELVLVNVLTGMDLRTLQFAVRTGAIQGLHPKLTSKALSRFERLWGRTPDILQLAHPNKMGNVKGYMTKPRVYTRCGECVEMDNIEMDFNEEQDIPASADPSAPVRRRVKKLLSAGGASGACIYIDVYSGFVGGHLIKSTAKAVESVAKMHAEYKTYGHNVEEFAADRGILHDGKFRVLTPEVMKYCQTNAIKVHGAEPGNHANGTEHIERVVQPIKKLQRFAVKYALGRGGKYSRKLCRMSSQFVCCPYLLFCWLTATFRTQNPKMALIVGFTSTVYTLGLICW